LNTQDLLEHQAAIFTECVEILRKKNHDYSNDDQGGDAFANFRLVETFDLCEMEKGVFIRLLDKVSRLKTFMDRGELKANDETVNDAINDIINYLVIISAIIAERGAKSDTEPSVTARRYDDPVTAEIPCPECPDQNCGSCIPMRDEFETGVTRRNDIREQLRDAAETKAEEERENLRIRNEPGLFDQPGLFDEPGFIDPNTKFGFNQ
jgi:hypothetical protein